MTTLPTREDGGIDWGRLYIEDGAVWKTGSYEPIKLEDIAKHTRERCAKVAEAEKQAFLSPEYAAGQPLSSIGERVACDACAVSIRKMEV